MAGSGELPAGGRDYVGFCAFVLVEEEGRTCQKREAFPVVPIFQVAPFSDASDRRREHAIFNGLSYLKKQ
jgi:hypothetical protein